MRFSISCGFIIDRTCFLFVLWVIELLRGWKFDEIEDISSSTEKPNSYSGWSWLRKWCWHGSWSASQVLSFGLAFDIEKSTTSQSADDPTGPHIEMGAPAN
jgi:hypothetical protein